MAERASVVIVADAVPGLAPEAARALEESGFDLVLLPEEGPERLSVTPDLALVERALPAAQAIAAAQALRALPGCARLPAIIAIDRCDLSSLEPPGALEDFICRPIDPPELAFRARLALARTERRPSDGVVRVADLVIDTRRYEVTVAGARVDLTLKEYELLLFLAQHRGDVFTRDVLLERIWGHEFFGGTRTVDVHVRRLRSKIERGGRVFVDTVRGVGYKFNG